MKWSIQQLRKLPTPYHFSDTIDFSEWIKSVDDIISIDKVEVDEMVWTNILLEKPINVTLPNAHEILKSEGVVLDDTEGQDIDDEEVLFYSNGIEEDKN